MADDSKDRKSRSGEARDRERSRDPDRERERERRRAAAKTGEAAGKVKDTAAKGADAVKKGADAVSGAMDGVVDAVGGYDGIDKMIKTYNRTLYDFVQTSWLGRLRLTNRPSKFLFMVIGIGLVQSLLPVFGFFVDFVARLVGFMYLYTAGEGALRGGFRRPAARVRSLLVCFMVCSALELVPRFLFDTYYHLGALWALLLPVILTTTPFPDDKEGTVAGLIADMTWAPLAELLEGYTPDKLMGDQWESSGLIVGGVVALLFWAGYLGATGSYMAVWGYLAFQTATSIGSPALPETSSRYAGQMTVWHNVLAIWLWRYLISAIESLSIPGVVSVLGIVTSYIPSYYLWITVLFVAMLVTKKTEKRGKADTWYARMLISGVQDTVKSSSSASSGSGSGSSKSGSSSSRSGETRSSSSGRDERSRSSREGRSSK